MAVVARKRKGGKIAYYVSLKWDGKKVWEFAGRDKRAARSLNAQRRQEMRDGTYQPRIKSNPTFREYANVWLARRTVRSKDTERTVMELHVLSRDWFCDLRLAGIRTLHIRQLLDELRATVSKETKKPLSVKYVANIYGVLRQILKRATKDEIIHRDPCDGIERREVKRKTKSRSIYTLDAIRKLLTSPDAHPMARMFAAIAFLTGAREGEVCGLRWSDWDRGQPILSCLTIERQYDNGPLKTDTDEPGEHARRVPVHPALAALLDAWWRAGFEMVYARKPTASDPIVPAKGGGHHTRSSAYKMWRKACEKAAVDNISLHSTRHTFITLACRRALSEVVEKITHNRKGDIVQQYTHRQWDELCAAVLAIDLNPPTAVLPGVTHVAYQLPEWVEALGIEPCVRDVTTGKDQSSGLNDLDAEPPAKQASAPIADADCDAEHLPPGLVAIRVERDGMTARTPVRPDDTAASLAARVGGLVSAIGATAEPAR